MSNVLKFQRVSTKNRRELVEISTKTTTKGTVVCIKGTLDEVAKERLIMAIRKAQTNLLLNSIK